MAENLGGIYYDIEARTEGLLKGERQVRRSTGNITSDFDRTGRAADHLRMRVGRLAGAISAALSVRQVVAYSDAWNNAQNQIRTVTDSQEDLAKVSQQIIDITRDTRASLEATSTLYARFRRGVDETVFSDERLLGVTKTINQALAVSGATASESEGALRQLAQGLASGALRGEEFNSVSEQAPGILRAVSIETGMAIGELREFAAQGGITAELLIKSLENYADTAEREFNATTRTFSQSLQVARTNAIEFVGTTESLTGATGLAGDAIVFLSENIDDLVNVAAAGVAVFGARFVGSLASATAAFIAAQVQGARYQATLASMAGVSRGAAASQLALSRAVAGARGAFALLGGPAGVIFLAAAALATWVFRTDEAAERTGRLKIAVDGLVDSFEDMDVATTVRQLESFEQQADDTRKRLEEIDATIKSIQETAKQQTLAGDRNAHLRALNQIAELEDEAESLTDGLHIATETAFELQRRLYGIAEGGDPFEVPSSGAENLTDKANEAGAAVRSVAEDIAWAQEKVRAGVGGDEDPFDIPESGGGGVGADTGDPDSPRDPGDIGLTRLDALKAQYERERELLEQSVLTEQEIEARKTELYRQYSEQRRNIMEEEKSGMMAALEEVGFSFDSLANRGVGALAQVAAGMQDGEEAAKQFAQAALTELLGALIRMGIQAITAQTTQAAAAQATGAAITAAYTPAAIAANIASFGGASVAAAAAAPTAAAGTIAAIQAGRLGGGRLNGGPVNPGTIYPVTEDGNPELLMQGGKQFLLPGARGEVISNKNMTEHNSGGNITVQQTFQGGSGMTADQLRNMVFDSNVQDAIYSIMQRQNAKRGRKM